MNLLNSPVTINCLRNYRAFINLCDSGTISQWLFNEAVYVLAINDTFIVNHGA